MRMIGSAIARCLATGVAVVRRGAWGCALPLALGVLIASGGASAAAAESCPNEKVREESNLIPGSARHYSQELPECRAYGMVSPLEKGSHDADIGGQSGSIVLPLYVAPGGEAIAWHAEGAFGGAGNFTSSTDPENPYLSQRTGSGWETSFFDPPRSVVDQPFYNGIVGDASPDLRSVDVACGDKPEGSGEEEYQSVLCAERPYECPKVATPGKCPWLASPPYTNLSDLNVGGRFTSIYFGMGWSTPTVRAFIGPQVPLLPEDAVQRVATDESTGSIYEIAGPGSASTTLRLVNIDNQGHVLLASGVEGGNGLAAPSLGSYALKTDGSVAGSEERAISQSGETVFFTATPNSVKQPEQTLALYARVPCRFAALPCDTTADEGKELVEGRQTVNVSDPGPEEGCEKCNTTVKGSVEESGIYQGASADGSKVFFTTTRQLLGTEEAEPTPNLYEYDFNGPEGHKVVKLSETEAPEGAKVESVVAVSPDGSHVYFLADGALPGAEPNKLGESPVAGQTNLYVYDTDAKAEGKEPLKLVVEGSPTRNFAELEQPEARRAQTTPDGRFLVFSAPVALAGDLNTKPCSSSCPQAVYRYDAENGELIWVSHSALEADGTAFKDEESNASYHGEGDSAIVGGCSAPCAGWSGAVAARGDLSRAISDNGQYLIFMTPERLQAGDVNGAADVYVWHEGAVHMISDGHNPQGIGNKGPTSPGATPVAAMSASGSDIFFTTRTELLPRDTDDLVDVYDARIDGGFPEPVQVSCPPAAAGGCQGSPPPPPPATTPPTSFFPAGGNLLAPLASSLAFKVTSKPLTPAQKLASALKACREKHERKQRVACERQAKRKYAAKKTAKKTAKKSGHDPNRRGGRAK